MSWPATGDHNEDETDAVLSLLRSGSSRMLTGGMDGKTSGGALGNGDEAGLLSALRS